MRRLLALFVFLSAALGQTAHLSVIQGTPSGAALNINGPTGSGNGSIVLSPGAGAVGDVVQINAGRTDTQGLIVFPHAGDITTNDIVDVYDHAGGVVFGIAGHGVSGGIGPDGVYITGNTEFYNKTTHNYLEIGLPNAGGHIDGTNLGGALNISGANAANGSIVFNPGNVAGHASVNINNSRTDMPELIINQQQANCINGDVEEIWDGAGNVKFAVTGCGVAAGFPGPNALSLYGNVQFDHDDTYFLGNSSFALAGAYAYEVNVSNVSFNIGPTPSGFTITTGGTGVYQLIDPAANIRENFNSAGAMSFIGSPTGSGNIYLQPGAVSGLASVVASNARTDQPALIIEQSAGDITSNDSIHVTNHAGGVVWAIAGSGVGGGAANQMAMYGNIIPNVTSTYNFGSSSLSFNLGYFQELVNNSNTMQINGAVLSWPSANAAGQLTNNGSGGLTWAASSFTCGSGTNEILYYDVSHNCLAGSNLIYDGSGFTINVGTAINANLFVDSVIPNSSHAYSLGNGSNYWANLYIDQLITSSGTGFTGTCSLLPTVVGGVIISC